MDHAARVNAADARTAKRAVFDRLPLLRDLVPFVPLADGLPTPVEAVEDRLWVQRDDRSSSLYGGNKVRKLEFTLAVPWRRGAPVVTAGGTGSHHVVATALHGHRLGLDVEAVVYPQPETEDVRRSQAHLAAIGDVRVTRIPSPYLMPAGLAARLAALAPRSPYFLWPGASTALGALGHVSAGLELVAAFDAAGEAEPDHVVVALGSGGSAVGLAVGVALGGWRHTTVVGVRVADRVVTNRAALGPMLAGTQALLAMAGGGLVRPRWQIDGRQFGRGYGYPTTAGERAAVAGTAMGVDLEPTYTAKAFAAALDLVAQGRRVVFVQTFAGVGGPAGHGRSA